MQEWNLYGYYGMFLVAAISMFVVSLSTYKKYKLKFLQAFIFTVVAMVGGLSGTMVMGNIYTSILRSAGLGGGSRMAIYGALMFVPIIVIVAALITSQPWRQLMDMLAPAGLFFTAFAKLGCMFNGCCQGIECSFGLYNFKQDAIMFPAPILEFITMIAIIGFTFHYGLKSKKYIPGTVYPVMVSVYAVTRFLVEYIRYYPSNTEKYIVFGVLSFWQLCCIITIAFSVIWYLGLKNDWLGKIKATVQAKKVEREEAEAKARAEIKRTKKNKKKKKK